MLNSVNSVYYHNQPSGLNIKTQNTAVPTQKEVPQNVSFKGTEALAAYNYSLVNKDELFNLPVIQPLEIPKNLDDIKGERIYNSDGKLMRIICNDENKETKYYFRDNTNRYYSRTVDKKTGDKWEMCYDDGVFEGVSKIMPDGTEYSTFYENGEPVQVMKYKMTSKGNDMEISYSPKDKSYSVQKHYTKDGKQYSSFADYNENRKCTYATETEGLHNETTDLNFIDGKPYNITTTKSKALDSNLGKDDIDLTNLEPAPFYNVDIENINTVKGERKYYSNGKLEKIIADNGEVYTFYPEGNLYKIENKNKKIELFYEYQNDGYSGLSITETMPNGGVKTTQYGENPDDYFDVWYEEPGCKKHAGYNNKGNLISYWNKTEGQKEISRDYDENGNLIRCWDEYL